jgi:GT2 family glycosyltransferase
MPGPDLSVVLSTLGNYDVLRRVLDGYARQTAPVGSFEVTVVVDSADPDPGAAEAAIGERPFPTRRLTGPVPGLSANRNAGWRAAAAPVVLFADNDTIPVPELVAEHLAWHREHPEEEVAVVGHIRWSPELRVTPFMKWLDEGIQFDYRSIRGTEASWWHLYGANSSVKRAMLERVGGFDEERLPYLYDDLDWAYRASGHGLRVLYNPRAVVNHYRPGMTPEFWQEKAPRIAAAERAFVAKHPEADAWFFEKFSAAAQRPPARGRGARLARLVPERVPWLGPRVWASAREAFLQRMAPAFLEGWERAGSEPLSAEWLAQSSDGGRAASPAAPDRPGRSTR